MDMEEETWVIICTVSLGPNRGYKCHPPALPTLACPSFSLTLSFSRFINSQLRAIKSAMSSLDGGDWPQSRQPAALPWESSSGHGPAQREPDPEGPLL